MIKVDSISVHEFRGIRKLKVDFKGKNFAVCGRNGTGKSGLVDALEFALTGSISRLSGEGTKGISVKDHAPHVDSRDNPDKARVMLTVTILSLNKQVTIERNVKTPSAPKITPSSPGILAALQEVAKRPEFTLSRRELIKYVISTPGDRAKEVQALLRLTRVENTRAVLTKIANGARREVPTLKHEKQEAQTQLIRALEIATFSQDKVLDAANERRAMLGLPPLKALTSTASLKDGLTTTPPPRVPKIQALDDATTLRELLDKLRSQSTKDKAEAIKAEIRDLARDTTSVADVTRENVLRSSLTLIDEHGCPVCDTPWKPDLLRAHIEEKLKKFEAVAKKRADIEEEIAKLVSEFVVLSPSISTAIGYAKKLNPPLDAGPLETFDKELKRLFGQLKTFLPLEATVEALDQFTSVPSVATECIAALNTALSKLPDPTKQDAARDYLTVCQERLEAYRNVSLRHKSAEEKSSLANEVSDVFAKVSTEVLNNTYTIVEKEFSALYRYINKDDEDTFTAKLIPSTGKLGFDVDFYGRGYFPPGAYHSEGHQDGMGVCLYLALMRHLLGSSFTFAVLDDVLMSVDSGHRREVCSLLKEKFPDTQFILTTHDPIWLKHMRTAGLIDSSSFIHFRKWDVDHGPSEWSDRDVWQEIEDDLASDDVRSAASLMRHYLEFVSAECCHRLRARVEFRGDAQFQLGDLLPAATSQFTKLLSEAEKAALSWGRSAEAEAIKSHKQDLQDLITKSQLDQWQTNAAIHYNEWENLSASDFRPVVGAFRKLVEAFFCSEPACGSLFEVIPERGKREVLKCSCGSMNLNFQKKKSS